MPDESKDTNPWTMPSFERTEQFEVVLLKSDVAPHVAKPADFKRVPVVATGTLAAMWSDAAKVDGYRAICVTKPGVSTQDEVLARQREIGVNQPPIDRARV